MFSGSMSVLSRPISWTAPPNSGSESQIICLITTFISRTSCKQKTQTNKYCESPELYRVYFNQWQHQLYSLFPCEGSIMHFVFYTSVHLIIGVKKHTHTHTLSQDPLSGLKSPKLQSAWEEHCCKSLEGFTCTFSLLLLFCYVICAHESCVKSAAQSYNTCMEGHTANVNQRQGNTFVTTILCYTELNIYNFTNAMLG